jgi:hypothetical protein
MNTGRCRQYPPTARRAFRPCIVSARADARGGRRRRAFGRQRGRLDGGQGAGDLAGSWPQGRGNWAPSGSLARPDERERENSQGEPRNRADVRERAPGRRLGTLLLHPAPREEPGEPLPFVGPVIPSASHAYVRCVERASEVGQPARPIREALWLSNDGRRAPLVTADEQEFA